MAIKTYDHTKVNISIDGGALTDFNGDVTVEKQGDDFEVVEGSNGAVERSRMVRKLYTVTLPFMQTSPQLNIIEGLRQDDEANSAGPYVFTLDDLNGTYSIKGLAWIKSMGSATKGRATAPRTVTLDVFAATAFEGV